MVIRSNTSLCFAAYEGHLEIVRLLLEAGADKIVGTTRNNTTYKTTPHELTPHYHIAALEFLSMLFS